MRVGCVGRGLRGKRGGGTGEIGGGDLGVFFFRLERGLGGRDEGSGHVYVHVYSSSVWIDTYSRYMYIKSGKLRC